MLEVYHVVMSEEETQLIIGSVKYKKQDGILVLTRSQVAWSPEGSSEVTFNSPYSNIKSHKISKETGSKVQLQLVHHDGSTTVFHFVGADPKSDRSQVSDLLLQMISKASQQTRNPEMEAKWNLLQDADLYRLYRDMVVSGVITAEEFWANRWNGASTNFEQQSGLPSAFLVDIQAISGCNTVQYQLTTDIIENIFRMYPSVKTKHAELVPDKLSEEQFWVQFFQSQKFHRNRLPQKPKENEVLFQELLETDINAIPQDSCSDPLLPSIDNPFEDLEETAPDTKVGKAQQQILKRCNQHSTLVLHAIQSDVGSSSQKDLRRELSEEPLQLAIGSSHLVADTPSHSLVSLAQMSLQSSSQQPLLPTQAHSAVVHLLPGGSLMTDSSSLSSSFAQSTVESLCRYQRSLAELLRHFWACFPIVNQQLEQKVHRMAQCLQDFKDKQLSEFQSQLSPSELILLEQLETTVNMALFRYQDWLNKQQKLTM